MNKKTLKAKITKALRKGVAGTKSEVEGLVPKAFTAGKLYEAYVLALVCQRLKNHEGCTLKLIGSTKVALKSSPGPINPSYPHIEVTKGGAHLADIWTDVEFTSLSAAHGGGTSPSLGDYHEIDIAMVKPGATSRPHPEHIMLAAECKNTGYQKSLLREILGIRRELSLLTDQQSTAFSTWPRSQVPANPASCVLVYSTDAGVTSYMGPSAFFGIDFFHEPL